MSRDPYVVAQGLIVEWESLDAIKALREAGVRSILLKGPLQQWWLEPGGPPRASGDVDLFVAHEQIGDAESALGSIGYARAVVLPDEDGREHASVWVAPVAFPSSFTGRSSASTRARSGLSPRGRPKPPRSCAKASRSRTKPRAV